MVRDPSDRLALPHWCGHWGGVITNTVQDRGARCRGSVVPPLPDGDGGVTDRATRGACSAGSGVVRCTTSLGMRPSYDASRHRLGFVWDRTTPGWASPSISVSFSPAHHLVNCQNSCCARGEGALTECVAGEGRAWAQGGGWGGAQPCKKH